MSSRSPRLDFGLTDAARSRLQELERECASRRKEGTPQDTEPYLETAVRFERAVLGSIMERPELISQVECDLSDDFLLADHRNLWRSAIKLQAEGIALDVPLWCEESKTDIAYVSGLLHSGYVPENFQHYVSEVQKGAQQRRYIRLYEELGNSSLDDRPRILEQMQQACAASQGENWRGIFHTVEEFEQARELRFAINGFLQEAGVTFIGGLSGHGKTFIMLAMAKALLEGEKLFGYFAVPRRNERVVYLIPECTISPFKARIEIFGLEEYIRSGQLLVRTLSSKQDVPLTDPRLLRAVRGADVFLDTAVRFMEGGEDVESSRIFARTIFGLLSAGARDITAAHHSPKGSAEKEHMTLENVLRGSGDLGAAVCTVWGLRQIDEQKNRIYVQNVKSRDFQPCEPFIIEGGPHLDQTGHFALTDPPGFAGELQTHLGKRGAPPMPDREDKQRQALELKEQGLSIREIAKKLKIGKTSVERWVKSVPEVSHNETLYGDT